MVLAIQKIFQALVWIFTFMSTRLFSSVKTRGTDNLKNIDRPLLIIANHRSFWDPFIIGTLFPLFSKYLPFGFMVADGYYKIPFLKPFFWLTRTFPANKGKGLDISLKGPRQVLKNGGVFLIFPTGQRHYLGRQPRPRRGAAVLALEIPRLNVLPIYLKTISGWSIIDFLFKHKSIQIIIGRPFKAYQKTASKNVNKISRILADEIFKLNK